MLTWHSQGYYAFLSKNCNLVEMSFGGIMKEIKYFNGTYYQGNLSDNNAQAICDLLDGNTCVTDLKHMITNLPYHVIQDIIDRYETDENAMGFVKEGTFPLDKNLYPGTLRDEQTVGVAFMYLNGSCLLGDEVGLGKTVQVAGFMNVVRQEFASRGKHFSALFLSEKTSVEQIRSKLIQFTGEYVGLLHAGTHDVMEDFAAHRDAGSDYSVVATHAALDSNVFLESISKHPFDVLILDETAILRNKNTSTYYNARALSSLFKHIIALNATPVELTPTDIYNQLDIIDPTLLPTRTEFESTFCKKRRVSMYRNEIVGYKNEDIFRKAVSLRYLARTRADLGGSYEDNEYKIVVAPLSSQQKVLMKKTSLHQMCSDYPTGVSRRIPYTAETCGKVKVLLDLLKECEAKIGKALVYVKYKECQAELKSMIEAAGYSCAIINGEVSGKNRGRIIDDANSGMYDVVLTNIYRAYDLPNFVNCIFYTVDPNPQKMVQFEGRITRDVDVIGKRVYLIFSEGIEMEVLKKLQERISASRAFTTTGRSLVSDAIVNRDNVDRKDEEDDTHTLSMEQLQRILYPQMFKDT